MAAHLLICIRDTYTTHAYVLTVWNVAAHVLAYSRIRDTYACIRTPVKPRVQSVPTAMLVSSSWKAAVLSDQQRLYKGIVRRAGVTPLWRAGFWEFMILRRC